MVQRRCLEGTLETEERSGVSLRCIGEGSGVQCIGGARSVFSEGDEGEDNRIPPKVHPATPHEMELRKTFEEIKEKAQEVQVQRRKAEVFQTTYGAWFVAPAPFKVHATAPR